MYLYDMKRKGYSGVYIIQNLINSKCYIGASENMIDRLWDHKTSLRGNYHVNSHLQAAFNKYGEENFIFEPLEIHEIEVMYSFENYWCNLLDTHNREHGYNLDFTGPEGKTGVSLETRIKMGKNRKDKREVTVYTIYGDYFTKFEDLYKCAAYFNTAAANIHRKMNILSNKKNLIDSNITKYLLTDDHINIHEIKEKWDNIFSKIRALSGKYKVYDCFNNYIGTANIPELAEILNIKRHSVKSSLNRGTFIRTLKIK